MVNYLSAEKRWRFGQCFYLNLRLFFNEVRNLLVFTHDEAITKCELNSLFKWKLLTVYYPKKFIPVCAKDTLEAYCKVVGLTIGSNKEMVYCNIALLEWKNTHSPFNEWENTVFMRFCDWVWHENRKLDFSNL